MRNKIWISMDLPYTRRGFFLDSTCFWSILIINEPAERYWVMKFSGWVCYQMRNLSHLGRSLLTTLQLLQPGASGQCFPDFYYFFLHFYKGETMTHIFQLFLPYLLMLFIHFYMHPTFSFIIYKDMLTPCLIWYFYLKTINM